MYIQIDEDFQEHPKSRRLCRILMDPRGWSWCVLLWRYCTKFHEDGDLTGIDPADLEYSLGWTLDEGKLFRALVDSGFIDQTEGKTMVHDWMEHQGLAIVKMRTERERKRSWRATGATPNRRAEDESDVSTRNLVSVRGRSADGPVFVPSLSHDCPALSPDVPRTFRGRSADTGDGNDISSTYDTPNVRASDSGSSSPDIRNPDTECCEPLAGAKDSQPASASGDAPRKRKPRQPAPPDGTPVIRTVACNGPIPTWDLTEGYVAKAQEYFPALDVKAKIMSALYWLDANPDRRKTAGGMTAFLARWIARENNGHQGQMALPTRGPPGSGFPNRPKTQYPKL